MAAVWENFLRHEFSIWKEFFVSPYIVPGVLAVLYWIQGQTKDSSWFSFLFSLLLFIPIFCLCTIVSAAGMCVVGDHVSWSAVLATYPLYFHFGLSTEAVNSIIAENNFYDHGYYAFYMLFIVVSIGPRTTPFKIIAGMGLSFVLISVCVGLAFGIQHGILSINWDWWRPQHIPFVANLSLTLAFSLWFLLLLCIRPLSTNLQRLIKQTDSDILGLSQL
jgi:hypothetical protein